MQLRPHQVRILERMQTYPKGQIIVPTGGGKTMCMIQDTAHVQQSKCGHTTVVVAPRILLAEQLCSEFLEVITSTYTHVMHVHSGETHHFIHSCLVEGKSVNEGLLQWFDED
jgi:superfamily II DNA or RNA helicase